MRLSEKRKEALNCRKMQDITEMEKNESRQGESSGKLSPDLKAFLDLVERERHRRLLDDMKTSEVAKPWSNDLIACHLSFEMEDFKITASDNRARDTAIPLSSCTAGREGVQIYERMNRGIKRAREMSPFTAHRDDKVQKSNASRMFLYDLNQKAESSDDAE